jgi:hypothetical protein
VVHPESAKPTASGAIKLKRDICKARCVVKKSALFCLLTVANVRQRCKATHNDDGEEFPGPQVTTRNIHCESDPWKQCDGSYLQERYVAIGTSVCCDFFQIKRSILFRL